MLRIRRREWTGELLKEEDVLNMQVRKYLGRQTLFVNVEI